MVTRWKGRPAFAAVTATLLLGLLGPAAAIAGAPITFEVRLLGYCVFGNGPASTSITVSLRSKDDDLKGRRTVEVNSSGRWNTCFWQSVFPTDRLIGNDGVTTRTFIVPNVTMTINRVSDVVSGKAPANSQVLLTTWDCQTYAGCASPLDVNKSTSSTGAFAHDFTAARNIRGYDDVQATWTSPADDLVTRTQRAPYFGVGFRNYWFWGNGQPHALATLTLRNSAGTILSTGRDYVDRSGYFSGSFADSAGDPVLPSAGNRVAASIASDASMTIKNMMVTANAGTDTISAVCFPNRPFYVEAQETSSPYARSTVYGTANSSGIVNADMAAGDPPGYDLQSGDDFYIECRNGKGDEIYFEGEVP